MTGEWRLSCGDALDFYDTWDTPTTIISDGAYGVGGFPGDPRTPADLPRWYEPHIAAWSAKATLATTLWLWNTEIGWANIHPLLTNHGWQYETLNIWNKGTGHIAGNVNSKTIRRFPVVTEVCAFYTRTPRLPRHPGSPQLIHMKEWLLSEWLRTGLPKADANKACGVKNAATRKYFDQGWLWYFPPVDVMMQLVAHANRFGDPTGKPYFSFDGTTPVSARRMGRNPERLASRARGDQCVGPTPAAEFGTLPGIHAAQRPTHPQANKTERQPPEPETARPHGTLHQCHHQPR